MVLLVCSLSNLFIMLINTVKRNGTFLKYFVKAKVLSRELERKQKSCLGSSDVKFSVSFCCNVSVENQARKEKDSVSVASLLLSMILIKTQRNMIMLIINTSYIVGVM